MTERSEWELDDKEIRRKRLQQRERSTSRRDGFRPHRDSNRPRRKDWLQYSLDEDDFDDVENHERIMPRTNRKRQADG